MLNVYIPPSISKGRLHKTALTVRWSFYMDLFIPE